MKLKTLKVTHPNSLNSPSPKSCSQQLNLMDLDDELLIEIQSKITDLNSNIDYRLVSKRFNCSYNSSKKIVVFRKRDFDSSFFKVYNNLVIIKIENLQDAIRLSQSELEELWAKHISYRSLCNFGFDNFKVFVIRYLHLLHILNKQKQIKGTLGDLNKAFDLFELLKCDYDIVILQDLIDNKKYFVQDSKILLLQRLSATNVNYRFFGANLINLNTEEVDLLSKETSLEDLEHFALSCSEFLSKFPINSPFFTQLATIALSNYPSALKFIPKTHSHFSQLAIQAFLSSNTDSPLDVLDYVKSDSELFDQLIELGLGATNHPSRSRILKEICTHKVQHLKTVNVNLPWYFAVATTHVASDWRNLQQCSKHHPQFAELSHQAITQGGLEAVRLSHSVLGEDSTI